MRRETKIHVLLYYINIIDNLIRIRRRKMRTISYLKEKDKK